MGNSGLQFQAKERSLCALQGSRQMAWMRHHRGSAGLRAGLMLGAGLGLGMGMATPAVAQVFTVGKDTATADIDTDFRPTRVELPDDKMTERGRRELIRDFEAEQGFAHRVLPLGGILTLQANGVLTPGSDAYRKLVYEKGKFADVGDRVAVTGLEVKGDRLIIDINGGPYAKHRFLRHIQVGIGPMQTAPNLNDGQTATGCRVVLVFEGGVPELSAPEVKALLYPIVDFKVKTGAEAYTETLPEPVKQAIATHVVMVGMNRQMVMAALGAPDSKVREADAQGERYEEWIYGHSPQPTRFVRFVGDRVSLVKIARVGQPIEIHDQDELAGYLPPKPTKTVVEGDVVAGDTQPGPPSLKKPGEVLPDETRGTVQNGRVQYPVPKPDPGTTVPAAGTTTSPPATSPPTPPSQNFSQPSLR
jgi:hypothetical protein